MQAVQFIANDTMLFSLARVELSNVKERGRRIETLWFPDQTKKAILRIQALMLAHLDDASVPSRLVARNSLDYARSPIDVLLHNLQEKRLVAYKEQNNHEYREWEGWYGFGGYINNH